MDVAIHVGAQRPACVLDSFSDGSLRHSWHRMQQISALPIQCRDFYDTELVTGAMRLNGTILLQEFAFNQVHRLDGAQCLERWLTVSVDVHDFSSSTARAVQV